MKKTSNIFITALMSSIIAGCGGGIPTNGTALNPAVGPNPNTGSGDTTGSNDPTSSAKKTPLKSSGEIDSFDGFVVNGDHYDANNSVVTMDGSPATIDQLGVGMIVSVVGEQDESGNKVANVIDFHSKVRGKITNIDLQARTVTVLGKVITINADTVLGSNINQRTLAPLSVGTKIRVSGRSTSDSQVVASRIDIVDDADLTTVTGKVTDLDPSTHICMIDGTKVNLDGVNISGLSNGDVITVSGMQDGDTLIAEGEIQIVSRGSDTGEPANVHIRGVAEVDANGMISVNGQTLLGLDTAIWEFGNKDDISNGTVVTFEGSETPDGNINVIEIAIERTSTHSVMVTVESVDIAEKSFTTLQGLKYFVTDDTDFRDRGETAMRNFKMEDLQGNNILVVTAFKDDDGKLICKSILRTRDETTDFVGQLDTTIKEARGTRLITTDDILIITTDLTVVDESIDLRNLVLGEQGDKLLIFGYYNKDKNFIASAIRRSSATTPSGF